MNKSSLNISIVSAVILMVSFIFTGYVWAGFGVGISDAIEVGAVEEMDKEVKNDTSSGGGNSSTNKVESESL
ncbi:MAG: hypothetical protein ABEJ65_10535 [bacterium]